MVLVEARARREFITPLSRRPDVHLSSPRNRATRPTIQWAPHRNIMDIPRQKEISPADAIAGLITALRDPNPDLDPIRGAVNKMFGPPDQPVEPGSQQEKIVLRLTEMWEIDPGLAMQKVIEDLLGQGLGAKHGIALATIVNWPKNVREGAPRGIIQM